MEDFVEECKWNKNGWRILWRNVSGVCTDSMSNMSNSFVFVEFCFSGGSCGGFCGGLSVASSSVSVILTD